MSSDPGDALARLAASQGVTRTVGTLTTLAIGEEQPDGQFSSFAKVRIGDCAALAEYARLDACADGDVFLAEMPPGERRSTQFVNVRRGMVVGVVVTLLLIGTSMLVGMLEQLRERRRLLAMLVAVGTPRRALGWSVLWQAAVPVLIGLGLAVVFGLGLGTVLLRMVGSPISVSWPAVATGVGLGGGLVLLVTGASLPLLWRLTRPEGLRAE
ncbi:ABC transporter permease [Micromonospora okii]|uniref:ABC transporter permease n=1 Tax=Micromonospora okii TaxID=1182970 RepID=UPI001E652CFB|nr:ABC transporter permease [Micromonospora okii]